MEKGSKDVRLVGDGREGAFDLHAQEGKDQKAEEHEDEAHDKDWGEGTDGGDEGTIENFETFDCIHGAERTEDTKSTKSGEVTTGGEGVVDVGEDENDEIKDVPRVS